MASDRKKTKRREAPPVELPPLLSPRAQKAIATAVLSAAVLALALYHWVQFFEVWGDENEHLYVARQVASGLPLYGAIHSARPPLIFAPLVLLLRLGAPALLAARLCTFVVIVSTALVLLWLGRRSWGLWPGLAAAVLFLVSPDATSFYQFVGIQQTALFALLCVALRLGEAPLWAGIAGGLAVASGQHSAVIVAVTALYQVRAKPRATLRFIGAAIGVIALVVAACLAMGGTGIFNDLVGQHFFHVTSGPIEQQVKDFHWYFGSWLLENAGILVLAVLGTAFGLRDAKVRFVALLAALHVLTVLGMNFSLIMYMFPAAPLFASLAGYGLYQSLSRLKLWSKEGGWRAPSLRSGATVGLVFLSTVGGFWGATLMISERDHASYSIWPFLRYQGMSRAISMKAEDRVAAVLARNAQPGDSIFGWPTLATYLAQKTGIRVSGQLADLSPQWVINDQVPRPTVVSRIEDDHVGFFTSFEGSFYLTDPFFQHYLMKCFLDPFEFPPVAGDGYRIPTIWLFKHKDTPRPCK
jgi:hypothetical protein